MVKKIAKWFRRVYRDLFGWDCNRCGGKYCTYFYDAAIVGKKRAEVYKCMKCEMEYWHWKKQDDGNKK